MRIITAEDINTLSAEELSDMLTERKGAPVGAMLSVQSLFGLAVKLVELFGTNRMKKRLEHLEETVRTLLAIIERQQHELNTLRTRP